MLGALPAATELEKVRGEMHEIDQIIGTRLRSGLGKRDLLKIASDLWNAAVTCTASADCKAESTF